MTAYKHVTIHFGEIWLRGKNRGSFIDQLHANIRKALADERYLRLTKKRDRFVLQLSKGSDMESISNKLRNVFGISWFAPVAVAKNNLKSIEATANSMLAKKDTVRIVASRTDKSTKFNSPAIVTHFIKAKKLKFNIDKNAKKTLWINVTEDGTFMFTQKTEGLRGLPVGSSGKAIILLSGGIDSPVASYYAMKRGLYPVYLHVHGFPTNEDAKNTKIKDLVKALSKYSANPKLYLVPAHVFQSSIMQIPKKFELVLFKRFIYNIAESIAEKEKADCIVTGESLGQVASQTVKNMKASEQGIDTLIIRPLIGFDKQEIIDEAREMGTFEISIRPYRDVCSIAARNPATGTNAKLIDRLYKQAKLSSALGRTMKKVEAVTFEL
ncbi:MAG: tRNA 4-thiouridine(8) synthase ThiI [Candidatus Micrarchaeota archaeon]|nr:tRNA 4-thiouridine(8) synthase ThiI [Candidatus Micrarchaeota archaeon]